MIVFNHGFQLLVARVYYGDYVYVFVLACPKLCISGMVCVLKCNFARLLFEEFAEFRLRFWGGYLWFEGYVVRTLGVVAGVKIDEYINKN